MNLFATATDAVDLDMALTDAASAGTGVLAIILAFLGTIIIVALVWYILRIIAFWKIFSKMGEAGWKSIIPFYSDYILFKNVWTPAMFFITLAITIVSAIVSNLAGDSIPLNLIVIVLGIAEIVIYVKTFHYLSKAFGHGAGFTCGLIFLNSIFTLILGLGSSEYIGNTYENGQESEI